MMDKPGSLHKAEAIHAEATEGIKKLEFYADELNILSKRLQEITEKYTSAEILNQVADFREIIFLKCMEIDAIKSEFIKEEFITGHTFSRLGENTQFDLQHARDLHERVGYLQKEAKELWNKVNKFLSKWM